MEKVPGVLICLYKNKNGYYRYGVLKRTLNWEGWELVKGSIDGNESPKKAAKREIREETGIKVEDVESIGGNVTWTYKRDGKNYKADYKCFMAEVPSDAKISVENNEVKEHSKGLFLNYRDSKDILTYENHRELLEKVHKKLET